MARGKKYTPPEVRPPGSGLGPLNRDNATFYGHRGGRANKPQAHWIDAGKNQIGEWLTWVQLGARLSISSEAARSRYQSLRRYHGKVTWDNLCSKLEQS